MDRFFSKVAPTEFNIHKVIFISIVMATKFLDDEIFTDQMMADIGGVTVDSLCDMEVEFLDEISFKVNVDEQIFKHFEKIVLQRNKLDH